MAKQTHTPKSPSPHPDLPARVILELLRSGQSVCFIARGGSMWPAIPSGSRLELEPCPAAQLQVGEIAAFERDGRVVVHRITNVTHEGVHFQGDNRDCTDGPIHPSRVLARARVLERRRLRLRWPRHGELTRAYRAVVRGLRPWLVRKTQP